MNTSQNVGVRQATVLVSALVTAMAISGCAREPVQGKLVIRNSNHLDCPPGTCTVGVTVTQRSGDPCEVELAYGGEIRARKNQKVVWQISSPGFEFYEPPGKWGIYIRGNKKGFQEPGFNENKKAEYSWKSKDGEQVGEKLNYDLYVRKTGGSECVVKDPVLVNSNN